MAKRKTPPAPVSAPGHIGIQIGIGDKARNAIAAVLSRLRADTCTLYRTTHGKPCA